MSKTQKPKSSSSSHSGSPGGGSKRSKGAKGKAERGPTKSEATAPTSSVRVEPPSSVRPGSVIPGYDLDVDAEVDVAPIGPTEAARVTFLDPEELEREPRSVKEIEHEIRSLEERLDELIQKRTRLGSDDGDVVAGHPDPVVPVTTTPIAEEEPATAGKVPPARDVLASHGYLKEWGRTAIRERSEEVDEFGLDRAFEESYRPLLDFLHRFYFRVETEGASRIPETGRCIIVCNHSGGPIPYDGLMLRTIVRREHPAQRDLRWLSEDFIYYLPFAGTFMTRLGAVRACPENAERLLAKGGAVAVFPEGEKGIGKLFRQRYRLQRFGRGGFIRLGLRTQSPIIPAAIVGAEESNPLLFKFEGVAKAFGIPYLPVTPTFPALGAAGLLPAPTKWRVCFGDPLNLSEYGPRAADDDILVTRLSEQVRGTIQGMLDRMVAGRRSVWLG